MKEIMALKIFLLFFVTFLSLSNGKDQIEFYKLALQWPNALCNVDRCSMPAKDVEEKFQRFTIHGLWPFASDGTILPSCPGQTITKSQVKTIKDELTSEWPSFTGKENFAFWKLEWERHGTCSGLEALKYFERVLKCRKRFGGILGLQHYKELTPGAPKPHSLIAFHEGLREALGNLSPQLKCNMRNGGYQLEGVNICFDSEAEKPINCSSTIPKFISCGRNERAQLFFADQKTLVKKARMNETIGSANGTA